MKPIQEYKQLGISLKIFENRLETKIGLKKEMILFRNITSIDNKPMLAGISIKTSDGKKHLVNVPMTKKEEAMNLILSRM